MLTSAIFLATVLVTNLDTGEVYQGELKTQDAETCVLEVEAEMKNLSRELENKGIRFEMTGTCRKVPAK